MNREAGPLLKPENPTPELGFSGLSEHGRDRRAKYDILKTQ